MRNSNDPDTLEDQIRETLKIDFHLVRQIVQDCADSIGDLICLLAYHLVGPLEAARKIVIEDKATNQYYKDQYYELYGTACILAEKIVRPLWSQLSHFPSGGMRYADSGSLLKRAGFDNYARFYNCVLERAAVFGDSEVRNVRIRHGLLNYWRHTEGETWLYDDELLFELMNCSTVEAARDFLSQTLPKENLQQRNGWFFSPDKKREYFILCNYLLSLEGDDVPYGGETIPRFLCLASRSSDQSQELSQKLSQIEKVVQAIIQRVGYRLQRRFAITLQQ